MLMPKPPKEFLVDSFIYKEYLGEGDWNESEYAKPITIIGCRIDRGSQYSFGPSGKQLLFNGLIFCYAGLTSPLPDFKNQSLVVYDGQNHTITNVVPVTEAYSDQIYSYEIEVV